MAVNVKLLKKVRKLIAEEPKRLNMRTWGRRYNKHFVSLDHTLPPCGTVACLAGWTVLASKPKSSWRRVFTRKSWRGFSYSATEAYISQRAAKLLGLPHDKCPFYSFNWQAPDVLAWIDRQIDAAAK